MIEAAFVIPGNLATATGGYIYDRRLMALLPARGVRVHHVALPASFPDPSAADLAESLRLIRAAASGVLVIDGLAYGTMPSSLIAGSGRPVIALVHHPLAFETGMSAARRDALLKSERAALAMARHVIVTSASTAQLLAARFGVSADAITVAEPGTDPAPRAFGCGDPVRMLSAGALVPRKGYDVLVAALSRMADMRWKATIAGAFDRAPAHVEQLRHDIARVGLAERITLVGELDAAALDAAYAASDLFVLPSYYEGFGMAAAEATARGLPVVTTRGCFGFAVPDHVGVQVPPGDPEALALCLRRLITDASARRRLAEAAWAHAATLPRWSATAARVARAIEQVSAEAVVQ